MLSGSHELSRCVCGVVFENSQKFINHCKYCAIHKQTRSVANATTSASHQASTVDHNDDDDNDDNQAATTAEIARKLRDDPMDCADIESIHENEF